jgi:valyl-tRNA synthetase
MTYTHKMTALPAQYDTDATEKKWQQAWLEQKTYAWVDDDRAENNRANSFVIDTPPPTVSGTLHMGHVYSYTQADFIARFQRMSGKNVFYPMGFDDNGLPTERLVEKVKKIRATDMSREAFIAECMGVSEEARIEFRALFQSIALSVDWDQEYHTISAEARRLSQLSFLDLVNKQEVYRALKPVNWDPVDLTTIAQAEIVDKEMASHFTDIVFTCEETGEELVIGTTRPELLAGCVAVFVHPDDQRYAHLVDTNRQIQIPQNHAITPLFGVKVPILFDDKVQIEKGTGMVMCCTFGDDTDVYWWQKYDYLLPARCVLNKYAKFDYGEMSISNTVEIQHEPNIITFHSGGLQGRISEYHDTLTLENCVDFPGTLELFRALKGKKVSNPDPKNLGIRETMLNLLKENGLVRDQRPITHAVKCAERSGAPLEILPTQQWFVRISDKKEALKIKADQCRWNPDYMKVRIDQWIDGLNQDWAISRQRYFGVPFPVWYEYESFEDAIARRNPNLVYASVNQLPINPIADIPDGYRLVESSDITKECQRPDGSRIFLVPEPDVMDTWATSSISPQLSAHGISAEGNPRFDKLFPADLRPQAHEIIRTWAFYTIVKAHLHNDSVPWHNLMISGWCLAEDKSKMSKSKGNVITPVALIEEKGADAVRYWAATSRLGQDTAFSPDLLKIGRKLLNKIWNATQFAAIHLTKMDAAPATAAADIASGAISEILDQWILARLGHAIAKATAAYEKYEYADALDATNQFFWADFCDNYLELIKKRVYNEDGSGTAAAQQSAVRTLYYVLDGILKLYAPVVPHVTEELYSHIFADDFAKHGSLHARGCWPKSGDYPADDNAEVTVWGELATTILEQIRRAKSDAKRSIKTPVTLARIHLPQALLNEKAALTSMVEDLKGAGNIEQVELLPGAEDAAPLVESALADEADAA